MKKRIKTLVLSVVSAFSVFIAGTTQAVTVAVLDTGLNPNESWANRAEWDYDYDWVNGDYDAYDDNNHGTRVANEVLVYSSYATVLPIKVLNSAGAGSNLNLYLGILDAYGHYSDSHKSVRVINLSLGGASRSDPVIEALHTAVSKNIFISIAAGNEGASEVSWPAMEVRWFGGGGLAVGAVDTNNQMKSYSNRAGVNKDHYVVVQWHSQPYEGTSFTAPMVSALAATLIGKWPHLSNQAVGRLICDTATDLGVAGNDTTYGCGLVHPSNAISPYGTSSIPMGTTVASVSAPMTVTALQLSPALGHALLQNSAHLGNLIALDEYGRDYPLDVGSLLWFGDGRKRFSDFVAWFRQDDGFSNFDLGDGSAMQVRFRSKNASRHRLGFTDDEYLDEGIGREVIPQFGFQRTVGPGLGLSFGHELPPDYSFSGVGTERASITSQLDTLDSNYLGFSDTADSLVLHYQPADGIRLNFGTAVTDEHKPHGLKSTAQMVGTSFDIGRSSRLGIRLSNLAEDGNLLGGSANGAFSVNEAITRSVGLSFEHRIGEGMQFVGRYARGSTQIDESSNSLLGAISPLKHETIGVGFLSSDLFRQEDKLGFAVTRPLRITKGSAQLKTPYGRDIDGNVLSYTEQVSLVPQDRETAIEAFYQVPVNHTTRLGLRAVYRDAPNHSKGKSRDYAIFVAAQIRF